MVKDRMVVEEPKKLWNIALTYNTIIDTAVLVLHN